MTGYFCNSSINCSVKPPLHNKCNITYSAYVIVLCALKDHNKLFTELSKSMCMIYCSWLFLTPLVELNDLPPHSWAGSAPWRGAAWRSRGPGRPASSAQRTGAAPSSPPRPGCCSTYAPGFVNTREIKKEKESNCRHRIQWEYCLRPHDLAVGRERGLGQNVKL